MFRLNILMGLAVFLCAGPALAAKEIRIGHLGGDQMHSPALMVMKEKKLLEAAGFTVKWDEFMAGGYAMRAMAAGAIDFAASGAVPVMIAHAQDVKLAVIAGANQEGSSLVVDDSIKTVRDLHNKRIGTPGLESIQDAMVEQLAEDNGLRIRRLTMKVSDMPLFLQKKEIDGFITWAPFPAGAVQRDLGRELLTSRDMMPGHQCCVLVTRESTLRDDPETVKEVLRVYLEAYKWFLDNQDESVKMLVKAAGLPENVVRRALSTVKYPYPPYCSVESMRVMAQGLIEHDKITNVKTTDLAAFIESLYRPELLEEFYGRASNY